MKEYTPTNNNLFNHMSLKVHLKIRKDLKSKGVWLIVDSKYDIKHPIQKPKDPNQTVLNVSLPKTYRIPGAKSIEVNLEDNI